MSESCRSSGRLSYVIAETLRSKPDYVTGPGNRVGLKHQYGRERTTMTKNRLYMALPNAKRPILSHRFPPQVACPATGTAGEPLAVPEAMVVREVLQITICGRRAAGRRVPVIPRMHVGQKRLSDSNQKGLNKFGPSDGPLIVCMESPICDDLPPCGDESASGDAFYSSHLQ